MTRPVGKAPELGLPYSGPFTQKPQENLYETAAREMVERFRKEYPEIAESWRNPESLS